MSTLVCCLASFFSGGYRSYLALQGSLQDGFCNGAVSSGVAKPGELASFHCCQQGFLLSSKAKGVYLLPHIFVCLVFRIRNAKEFPEAFHFKCLYMFLSVSAVRVQLSHS